MDERGRKGRQPAPTSGKGRLLCGREETGLGITRWCRNTRNSPARLESDPNGLGRVEEGRAWERPGRPGCDEGVNRRARDTRGSCDLFDREDVSESGHRRSADKGKSLASSGDVDSGLI
jgi:hypothetical protein